MGTTECLSKLFPHLKHSLWPYKCGTEECSCCGLDLLYYKHWYSGDESKGMKRSGHTFQMAVFSAFPTCISNIRKVTRSVISFTDGLVILASICPPLLFPVFVNPPVFCPHAGPRSFPNYFPQGGYRIPEPYVTVSLNTGTWTADMLLNGKKTFWKLFSRKSEREGIAWVYQELSRPRRTCH